MVRLLSAFMILFLSLPYIGASQEALRYFPLEQGNAWVYYHEHIVHEGIVIKPAANGNYVVTADTLTLRVNGTITELGNTYAILELDNKVWGYYRVEGNYLLKKYSDIEGRIVDFTPSADDSYEMNTVGLPAYRTVESRTLPCGVMTGYGCDIERSLDSLHEGKYMFFVDSIGPAYFSSYDAWKIPPERDAYYLMSYDVHLDPSPVQEIKVHKSLELHHATPNPFNSSTTIAYSLPDQSPVILTIYSITGKKVATLVDEIQLAGTHRVVFDGVGQASGVYFARLHTGEFVETVKMLLVK